VYKANKKGEAKDDYPSKFTERFSLSCFTSAFIAFVEPSDDTEAAIQKQGSVSDEQLGHIGQLKKEAHQTISKDRRSLDESKKE